MALTVVQNNNGLTRECLDKVYYYSFLDTDGYCLHNLLMLEISVYYLATTFEFLKTIKLSTIPKNVARKNYTVFFTNLQKSFKNNRKPLNHISVFCSKAQKKRNWDLVFIVGLTVLEILRKAQNSPQWTSTMLECLAQVALFCFVHVFRE